MSFPASAKVRHRARLAVPVAAKVPYQINERVTKAEMFKYTPTGVKPVGTGGATWAPAHEKAVVNLYQKLADSGLVAEDLHVETHGPRWRRSPPSRVQPQTRTAIRTA